jgi:hypothetical protein
LISLCDIVAHESQAQIDIASGIQTTYARCIVFAEIESLIVALGGEVREGAGSRIAFELNGSRRYLHRPHPGKDAKRYQVEEVREWFIELGVTP